MTCVSHRLKVSIQSPGVATLHSLPLLQAVGKDFKGHRLLVRVKLSKPASVGTLDGLLQLCATGGHLTTKLPLAGLAGDAAGAPTASRAAAATRSQPGLHDSGSDGGSQHSDMGPEGEQPAGRGRAAAAERGSREPGRGLRFAAGDEDDPPPGEPRHRGAGADRRSKARAAGDSGDEGDEVAASPRQRGLRDNAKWEQLQSPKVSGAGGKLSSRFQDDPYSSIPAAGGAKGGAAPGGRRGGLGAGTSSDGSAGEAEGDAEPPRGYGGQLAVRAQPGSLGMDVGDGGEQRMDDAASEQASEDELKFQATTVTDGDDEDLSCDWR